MPADGPQNCTQHGFRQSKVVYVARRKWSCCRETASPALLAPAPATASLRHTLATLLGAALMPLLFKDMFAALPTPRRFNRGFVSSLALRPSQIRTGDKVADVNQHAVRLHEYFPHSARPDCQDDRGRCDSWVRLLQQDP